MAGNTCGSACVGSQGLRVILQRSRVGFANINICGSYCGGLLYEIEFAWCSLSGAMFMHYCVRYCSSGFEYSWQHKWYSMLFYGIEYAFIRIISSSVSIRALTYAFELQ